jgi:hypothetical protein
MARWRDVENVAPDLAAAVKKVFDAHRHKTMATLRRDGSPRISGTELTFGDGEVWFGSMPGVKANDLIRDPRVALHSAPVDLTMKDGDAKISGRVIEVIDEAAKKVRVPEAPPGPFHLFEVDVIEIALTRVGDPPDHLVIESWSEGGGVRRVERR